MPPKITAYQRQYGRRIALARNQAGLTQFNLAKLVGLTRSSIANIEAGRQANSAEQVLVFARELKCDPRWLLTGWDAERAVVGHKMPAPYQPADLSQASP